MTTLMNGLMVPHFLIIDKTRTKEVNEKDEERKETIYLHKSSKITYHLLDEEERKRNNEDG